MPADSDLGIIRTGSVSTNAEPLADGFTRPTRERWEALVCGRDGEPERPLATALEDGLEVGWLYDQSDASAPDPGGLPAAVPYTRGTRIGGQWAVRQRHGAPARAQANAQILEDLEGGVTEILLALSPDDTRGTPVANVDELAEVLDGVLLGLAPVGLESGPHAVANAAMLLALWRRNAHPAAGLRGSLGLDPIGVLAHQPDPDPEQLRDATSAAIELTAAARAEFPNVQALAVDTSPCVEAGAGVVLELALATATGIAYLRAGESAGLPPAAIAGTLEFTFVAGPDQFLEIAKLRAARWLWSTVLGHCGVAAARRHSRTYVRTSRRMTSSLDPWVNILRNTSAAFAAGVGGADGVTVIPFDEPDGLGIGRPGVLGRRIARNTLLVLSEEASLHRVADPGGGAWYVESLTDQIARRAWSELQAIERMGGIGAALASGTLAERLAGERERRQDDLAHRRRVMTGVNMFPLLGDDGLERAEAEPGGAGAAAPVPQTGAARDTFAPIRDGAAFERLRRWAARLDGPRIALVNVGPLAAHAGANLWARGFFEVGGIETVSLAEEDVTHGEVRFAAVCAGRDADPAPVVARLRAAGSELIYLAGATQEAASVAGADVGVRDGVDMVAVLSELLDRLAGVPA